MNPSEEAIRFYDKMAKQNYKDWFNNDALLPTLTEFIRLLPPNPIVLDLGCGTGGESKRVINLGLYQIFIKYLYEISTIIL